MNTLPLLAARAKPVNFHPVSILPATLRAVTPRILFQNEFVSLVLIELKSGQRLHFAERALSLLTVLRGRVRMRGPHGSLVLHDFGHWRLERGAFWKIGALADASISLFIVKDPAAN
jgi:hypothetical protein